MKVNNRNGVEMMKVAAGSAVLRVQQGMNTLAQKAFKKEPGIDGILVTVGLCIIALLLCVVMKDSLTEFIESIVEAMKAKSTKILNGV